MRVSENISIKELLSKLEWDTPYSSRDLQALGLPSPAAARLAQSGWLKRLGRGVYQVPNAKLDTNKALALLSIEVPELHVGGKTALAWRGTRHNLSHQERLNLWGQKAGRLPQWFTEMFNTTYQSTRIFDNDLPGGFGLAPLPGGNQKVMVSVPERALLELFSDTGKLQSLEETLNLAENARHLRPEVLETLLAHTTRVKVVRLAKSLAENLELPWLEIARKHNERLGSSSRWIAVTRDKKILHLKK
jgi:Transcriptional regulator, AbiEi antitoxin, Type IV TA system/Transcriptional regulator, AbiEi antitoxin N-terminal domain